MKKKKSGGGGANWMDTYGDMVTLLLCFFVLLYSMSTISEEKWRAIVTSFNPYAALTPTENSGNDGPLAEDIENPGQDTLEYQQESIDDMIEALFQRLESYTAAEGLESSIAVTMEGGKIYVKFSDTAFFAGDSYKLQPAAQEILSQVCMILDQAEDAIEEIRIEGHTAQQYDNRPNETWGDRQLAGNRAAMVATFLQDNSAIHPARICSVGWGQWHPIAKNDEENRWANRRVEMVITGRDLKTEMESWEQTLSQYTTTKEQPEEGQEPTSTQEP